MNTLVKEVGDGKPVAAAGKPLANEFIVYNCLFEVSQQCQIEVGASTYALPESA